MKKEVVFNKIKSLSLSKIFLFGLSPILFTSCLPKEVQQSSTVISTNQTNYSGFAGAVSAQTLSATKVKVSWTPSNDPDVVAYNVYDATMIFEPKLIATVTAPASETTITGLTAGKFYRFRVRAANENRKEDTNKSDVSAIPYAGVLPADVQSSTSAYIPFNDGSDSDQINIYCKTSGASDYTLYKEVKNVTGATKALIENLTPGEIYTCRASLVISGYIDNNTATTTFTPIGTATTLEFTTQPGSSSAGSPLNPQPVIAIKDANGNTVSAGPDSSAIITLTVSSTSPSLGTVRGTSSKAAVKGVVTFTDIKFQEAGVKILKASKGDTSQLQYGSPALTKDSNTFTISPGPVSPSMSKIAISPEVPPNSPLVANGSSSYTVTITLSDEFGNPIIGTKPIFASSIAGDTLNQPVQFTDADGVTSGSISTTYADSAPPYRNLSISSPAGLSTVTIPAPFVPGIASKLAFTQQPMNSPAGLLGINTIKVAVQDAQGNTVTNGIGSTSLISLSIAANVNNATLTGTTVGLAVNGVAIFTDLGIDKTQTGYKLVASSGSYVPAYSNTFNITNGTPKKIGITGPSNVISGSCSNAVTIQLQDQGGNPAGAVQNTPVLVSGLGSASMYSSSSCSGTPLTSTITFTSNTHTKTVYIKDLKSERLSLSAQDSSAVLTPGTKSIDVYPNKIRLLAEAPPPAASGTPLSVVAGQCSTAITITTTGDNTADGPSFVPTQLVFTGISGSTASLYSDSSCQVQINPMSYTLAPTYGGNSFSTSVYLKDPKAEILNISVSDPNGVLSTISSLQPVIVGPSTIAFTGPTSVVAGRCSTSFLVTLKDTQGNSVVATADTNLQINGLSGSLTGKFFTNPSCSGTGTTSSLTIPQGSSTASIYFSDTAAENLSIYISDPTGKMTNSSTISLAISPSALSIIAPSPANSKTTVCAGPFTVNTLDGLGNTTNAITPIIANLTGSGNGGGFFSDSSCSLSITQVIFSTGSSTQYF